MFRVGQKVVCVSSLERGPMGETLPVQGNVYTIRSFVKNYQGVECLRLFEIVNETKEYREGFFECGFYPCRFRPLQSTETGMAILRKIADNPRQPVDA